ncbi:lipopolysaccharide biosynthesis protein [Motilimonas pumila]|nr:lipopolysaccharide biosynthesis protein [Motilimonas pumila]
MKELPVNELTQPRISPAMSATRQACLYGASLVLMKGTALIMLPFIAHTLTTEDLGRLELISSVAIFCSIMVGMGLEDTLFRFAANQSKAKARTTVAAIFALSLLLAVTVVIAGLLLTPVITTMPVSIRAQEWQLITLSIALESAIAVPLAWLRMTDKAARFFLVNAARALLQSLLIWAFVVAEFGITGILLAGFIACAMQFLLLAYWQLYDTGVRLVKSVSLRALSYSWPIVGSGLLAFGLNGLDRWLIADVATLADIAHYAIAAKFALACALLMQPFGMWWSAKRFQVLAQVNGASQCGHTISLGITVLSVQTVLVSIIAPYLIALLLPPQYLAAIPFCFALILVVYCKELVELINIGCFVKESTQQQLWINVCATATGIVIMLLAGEQWQIWGVIAGLLGAQLLRLVMFYLASQRLSYIPYPEALLLFITLSCALISVGHGAMWRSASWPEMAFPWLASSVYVALTLGVLGLANYRQKWWHWPQISQALSVIKVRLTHG